jgi:hypothetical protein
MESWSTEDDSFKVADFYNSIVELFDDVDDPWVIDTLAWWDK